MGPCDVTWGCGKSLDPGHLGGGRPQFCLPLLTPTHRHTRGNGQKQAYKGLHTKPIPGAALEAACSQVPPRQAPPKATLKTGSPPSPPNSEPAE